MIDKNFRGVLIKMLKEEQAHVNIENAVAELPFELLGKTTHHLPYTIWQLVEHIRITQWDIVEFSYNPDHESPNWPDEYWPKEKSPADEKHLKKSLQQIKHDREKMVLLIEDPVNDILQPFPYGDGQNLLREAILLVDHCSYHTGQIVVLRRLLGAWEG
jgi:uncharacterized damage-inducible protein DinB